MTSASVTSRGGPSPGSTQARPQEVRSWPWCPGGGAGGDGERLPLRSDSLPATVAVMVNTAIRVRLSERAAPGRPGAPSWWGGRACRRPPMLLRWLRRPERRRRRGGPTGVPQGTWTNQGVRDEVGATHWPLRGSASPAIRSTATSLPMGAPAGRSTVPREGGDDSAQAGPAAQVTPDPSIRGQREQTDPPPVTDNCDYPD